MHYYAAQIKTTQEENYILRLSHSLEHRKDTQRFIFPKRRLTIRKKGKSQLELLPVFPGYIFVETHESIDDELFRTMKKTPDFYRFLLSNQNVVELRNKDLSILKHFMNFNGIAEPSKVFFDANERIVVAEGPLKGLEGCIVKVDKRKCRAKIRLDVYSEDFLLDLEFTVLQKDSLKLPETEAE